MTSPRSGSEPGEPFDQLHPSVQRWVWQQGWTDLRSTQSRAVTPILSRSTDLIISAATASGKTEAAFLPILSSLASQPSDEKGVEVLYVAPLKALINDQFERLSGMCQGLDISVTPWHGDVPAASKRKLTERPAGILLITPESLEALFVLRGPQLRALLGALRYVVIDELHSFIASERGAQLQSLLHRVELVVRRTVPRIGLSATLGNMAIAARFLRPGSDTQTMVISADDDSQDLRLRLKGFAASPSALASPTEEGGADEDGDSDWAIAGDLHLALRGRDNLIFANSRRHVEILTDHLAQLALDNRVPNEFFAHHGSLSKELREEVEARLKDRSRPINAVCTSTLEMGIDIGSVASIAQIGAPPAVATLRQRLGRSGRRGEPAVLRAYVTEDEIDARTLPPDALRAQLVQTIAMINLLLGRWYEPPVEGDLHLSTFVQQLLSVIAQHGGLRPDEAFSVLCSNGTFEGLTQGEFQSLLRHLGDEKVLTQAGDGTLLLGPKGERIVNHYSFYAAFNTPDEWRLTSSGHQLGTLPIDFPLSAGLLIIFAGRRWRVLSADLTHKVVDLAPASGGRAPRFTGGMAPVHDRVRQEMLRIYQDPVLPSYLDPVAVDLLTEGRANFVRYELDKNPTLAAGRDTYLFLWAGDRVAHTVALALSSQGLQISNEGIALRVRASADELTERVRSAARQCPPDPIQLAATVTNKAGEKYDGLLPGHLLTRGYAAKALDPVGAWKWIRQLEL